MKFSSQLALVCLATGAYSRTVIERDLKVVTGVLSQVQTGIDNLDTVVKAFNDNPAPLTSASSKLVSTIKSGTTTIKGSSNLGLFEALALLQPVQDLQAHSKTLSDDLKAKRPAIQTAKQCDVTRQHISDIITASQALIDAVVSKVPKLAQGIAADQAAGISKVLNKAAADFAPGSCTNAA
ncbi:Hydrophobic surface binding protein A [Tolypocladium paradoxum]|uniref:Hydrophobic surface binding protein A n=1 Tax=Tolypocladium paradoxum TaxID=94208 RepID=A0A2S4KS15_9HYPO|nr:Hydrophobic surface binding protein A [Tolypocladium paradoxum]